MLISALDQQSRLPGVIRLREWTLVAVAGEATGLEPNPGLRAEASLRAGQAAVTFIDGNAYALSFEDASVDAVTCERVFQHLAEPARAAAEIARVLRPGGRVVVTDTDWATAIVHPGDPELIRLLSEAMRRSLTNPLAGRHLPGQLTAAGLAVDDVGSQALVQPPSTATGPLVRLLGKLAMDRGAITEKQRDQFLADLAAGAEAGDFHMSVTMFAVLAHRP